jgi:dolichol-phosphate mannosyltransferase
MKEAGLPRCATLLGVIAPTFNESVNVLVLAETVGRALGAVPWEMVFVDDDSPDGTAEVVTRIAAEHPNIRC